jgi:hypothetical protein
MISEKHPENPSVKPSKFPTTWDAQHAINVQVQKFFSQTEKHSTIVYTWQVPGEEVCKKIWNRISKTSRKVAEFLLRKYLLAVVTP